MVWFNSPFATVIIAAKIQLLDFLRGIDTIFFSDKPLAQCLLCWNCAGLFLYLTALGVTQLLAFWKRLKLFITPTKSTQNI